MTTTLCGGSFYEWLRSVNRYASANRPGHPQETRTIAVVYDWENSIVALITRCASKGLLEHWKFFESSIWACVSFCISRGCAPRHLLRRKISGISFAKYYDETFPTPPTTPMCITVFSPDRVFLRDGERLPAIKLVIWKNSGEQGFFGDSASLPKIDTSRSCLRANDFFWHSCKVRINYRNFVPSLYTIFDFFSAVKMNQLRRKFNPRAFPKKKKNSHCIVVSHKRPWNLWPRRAKIQERARVTLIATQNVKYNSSLSPEKFLDESAVARQQIDPLIQPSFFLFWLIGRLFYSVARDFRTSIL